MRMKFAARDRVFTLLYKGKELGFTFCDPLNGLGNEPGTRSPFGFGDLINQSHDALVEPRGDNGGFTHRTFVSLVYKRYKSSVQGRVCPEPCTSHL